MPVNFCRVALPLLLVLSLLGGRPAAAQQYPPWYPADSALVVRKGDSTIFRLNVDGSFYLRGTEGVDRIPVEGAGLRLMWFAGRGALRAGAVSGYGTLWDESNIGKYSVALGYNTRAAGAYSFAVGSYTTAWGESSVALGVNNMASGYASVALGHAANTNSRRGSFVFGDNSTTVDTIYAAAHNQATWRVAGGFRIFTSSDLSTGVMIQSGPLPSFWGHSNALISTSTGAFLSTGGTWTNASDVDRKHQFLDISGEDILTRLRDVPIRTWSYRSDDSTIRHLGPTAQDFRRAFGLGSDSVSIATIDADGVSLAAVQALDARSRTQRTELQELRAANESLRQQVELLSERLGRLEALLRDQQR